MNRFAITVSSIAHTVYSQDTNETADESRASYSRDEEQYSELRQEKEILLREHPVASERNENTNRLIKKIQDKMRKLRMRLSADVENISKPKEAKTPAERKREQRTRMSDSRRHPEKEKDRKRKRLPGGIDDTLEAGRYDTIHHLIFVLSRISYFSRGNCAEETSASGLETPRYDIIFDTN